jgi:serine/threonine protein kinase
MNSDRWEQINRIYDAALGVAEEERPAFLEQACGGDAELRREVESLLAYDQQAQQFIDRPALQLTAEKLASEPPSLVGQQLGPYQIQSVLGAGGMGEVYKARDTRLNRTVAIKVLPRHLSERMDLRQRFEREARAIASLDHPHICALYDVGHQGETDFLVMQYLEGGTLSHRLKKGRLPTEDVLRYSTEIAGALDTAHRKGVVHRDLKPGNIMLTETGAKLLDFGLAKRQPLSPLARGTTGGHTATESESLTEEGMLLGTLEIKVDAATGQRLSEARRFTQWSGFSFVNASTLSITADGKHLVVLRGNAQTDVYVAEFEPGGKAMKNLRRLTLVESDDAVWDWTADSRAVLFQSKRNGNWNWDIFKQDIGQTDAETIVATSENEWHPSFSPDGALILYLVSETSSPIATRLMRVPVAGGPPELVLSGAIKDFSCAREANRCVVVEDDKGKQVLTAFDPLKGRGEKLPLSDYPLFLRGILSPQGRLIEKMKSGPDGLHARVRSLIGGPAEEITFRNLIGDYQFTGWSVDGRGIYLQEFTPSDFSSIYAGLDGYSRVLWKRVWGPGWALDYPIPSPNGRYVAFTFLIYESNAWMLENF